MLLQISLVLLLVSSGLIPGTLGQAAVPGCPPLTSFSPAAFMNAAQPPPACFCDPTSNLALPDSNTIDVLPRSLILSCVYGFKLHELKRIISDIATNGFQIEELFISQYDSQINGPFPLNFFSNESVKRLIIDGCTDDLVLHPETFKSIESNLKSFVMLKCTLNPPVIPMAIRDMVGLEELELVDVGLTTVETGDLDKMTSLKVLNLANNSISLIERNAFSNLKDLEVLNLSHNDEISDDVFEAINQLSSLTSLDLSWNKITKLHEGVFDRLSNLEYLSIVHNFLEALDTDTFQGLSELVELDLRVNLIERIQDNTFRDLYNLRTLRLDGNYIDELRPSIFRGMSHLRQLGLSYNEFRKLPKDIFTNIDRVVELDLGSNFRLNQIDQEAFVGLTALNNLFLNRANELRLSDGLFQDLHVLKKLNLKNSPISLLTSKSFQGLQELEVLDVENSQLTDIPTGVFEPFKKRLLVLNLSKNPLNCTSGGAQYLAGLFGQIMMTGSLDLVNPAQTVCRTDHTIDEKTEQLLIPALEDLLMAKQSRMPHGTTLVQLFNSLLNNAATKFEQIENKVAAKFAKEAAKNLGKSFGGFKSP